MSKRVEANIVWKCSVFFFFVCGGSRVWVPCLGIKNNPPTGYLFLFNFFLGGCSLHYRGF